MRSRNLEETTLGPEVKKQQQQLLLRNLNCFLNLDGARRESKWEELYTVLKNEQICLMGVAETHLRDLEGLLVQLQG